MINKLQHTVCRAERSSASHSRISKLVMLFFQKNSE